jgi:hypothetical protein
MAIAEAEVQRSMTVVSPSAAFATAQLFPSAES